ncbi:MAG TPA: polymer-forming cytoskeletal protein [Gemmatimonadales bacterium]|nr:polymer-forming cytoskeletal protein [Gemmatimonadales bacterium]
MRTADRTAAAFVILIGALTARAEASRAPHFGTRLHRLLNQIPAAPGKVKTVTPQAIPGGGPDAPSVDIANLGNPVELEQRLRRLLKGGTASLRVRVPNGQARLGDFSVGASETISGNLLILSGQADLFGRVHGNVVALDGDIVMHPGAAVAGDVLAIGGLIQNRGGVVEGEQRSLGAAAPAASRSGGALVTALTNAAGLAGVLLTLGLIGFGVVLFARPNLETISDTVSHSFFRSFLTGLLAQILIIPTFGMLITGLVLSVVGILLVPFVVVVIPFLLLVAAVAGFLAVAHTMGETHLRRRMAAGAMVGSANSYRYLTLGLLGIGSAWLAWIAFGWVPVAGSLMFAAAFLATWLLATAGFGACLLSRAGIKPTFAGRYVPPEALTDEYLWATPQFGVSAVKRPEAGKGRP